MPYNCDMLINNDKKISPRRLYTLSLKLSDDERHEIDTFFKANEHYNKASFVKMLILNEIREIKEENHHA